MSGSASATAMALYDRFAADYDRSFETGPLRRVYDRLAWERVVALLPAGPDTVVDVGCGTGRWIERLRAQGHRVIGIEPSPGMLDVLRNRFGGDPGVEFLPVTMEEAEIEPGRAAVVLAMGSLQYAADPSRVLSRMAAWVRPGGLVCVHVDSAVALSLELVRSGKLPEALTRLRDRTGLFRYGEEAARLHLFDRERLVGALASAGLVDIDACGLLITASALGRDGCEAAITRDEEAVLAAERALIEFASLADVGKHILAWGRRPAGD